MSESYIVYFYYLFRKNKMYVGMTNDFAVAHSEHAKSRLVRDREDGDHYSIARRGLTREEAIAQVAKSRKFYSQTWTVLDELKEDPVPAQPSTGTKADPDWLASATPEECRADAKKYKTMTEWFEGSSQLYLIAGADNDLFESCVAHMSASGSRADGYEGYTLDAEGTWTEDG